MYNDGVTNSPVKINVTSFNGNLSNSFTFAKTWAGEISGWFNSSPSEGLIVGRSMGAVNTGLSKQLWNKESDQSNSVCAIFFVPATFSGYSRYADVDLQVVQRQKKR